MGKYVRCRKCRSYNIIVVQDNRNDFCSGLLGWDLTKSFFGAMMFANSRKSVFQCLDCGKVFKEVW